MKLNRKFSWNFNEIPVSGCKYDEFECDDLMCIRSEKFCDGVEDCSKGEDEHLCHEYNATYTTEYTDEYTESPPRTLETTTDYCKWLQALNCVAPSTCSMQICDIPVCVFIFIWPMLPPVFFLAIWLWGLYNAWKFVFFLK